MRRREFISLIGGATALPFAASAQKIERVRRVGVLMSYAEIDADYQSFLATFRNELEKLGWVENRNIQIDTRWGATDQESQARLSNELATLKPDLFLGTNTPTTASLRQHAGLTPIIFVNVADPIGSGFAASFARPGGNITGFTNLEPTMAGKWVELLKEIAPSIKTIACMYNPATAPFAHVYLAPFRAAATSFGVEGLVTPVHKTPDFEAIIAAQGEKSHGGLIVVPDAYLNVHRTEIISLAARHRVPAIYPYRYFTEIGGLLSYGVDLGDNYRRAATYTDRILRGTPPSELPVQAPVKFALLVNQKTARALGLALPSMLLARADEVIE